jgi:hypothetical protein
MQTAAADDSPQDDLGKRETNLAGARQVLDFVDVLGKCGRAGEAASAVS